MKKYFIIISLIVIALLFCLNHLSKKFNTPIGLEESSIMGAMPEPKDIWGGAKEVRMPHPSRDISEIPIVQYFDAGVCVTGAIMWTEDGRIIRD